MKTPEEIKKGLLCDGNVLPHECEKCAYGGHEFGCVDQIERDALAYIQKLEAAIDHAEKVTREYAKSITENLEKLKEKLEQAEREKDAAVRCLMEATKEGTVCNGCRHDPGIDGRCEEADFDRKQCKIPCMCKTCEANSNYQWRGVCDDDTEDKE